LSVVDRMTGPEVMVDKSHGQDGRELATNLIPEPTAGPDMWPRLVLILRISWPSTGGPIRMGSNSDVWRQLLI